MNNLTQPNNNTDAMVDNSVEELINTSKKATTNESEKNSAAEQKTKKDKALVMAEQEKMRATKLLTGIASNYRIIGDNYYFKNQQGKLAFRDEGKKLLTSVSDERVAFAMAVIAETRGWQAIEVKGSPVFRQQVWWEASLRGIKVNGYVPKEQELKDLAERRERLTRHRPEKSRHTDTEPHIPTHQKKTDQHQIVETIAATFIDEKVKDEHSRKLLKDAIAERLIERANANNIPSVAMYDKKAPPSEQIIEHPHYVTNNKERTR